MFTKKGDAAVLAKLGDAPAQYREIGERFHSIIRECAVARTDRPLGTTVLREERQGYLLHQAG
jgi:hypothetical protein